MMRLAYRHRKAGRLLLMERLKKTAPRAGFFEENQYRAVLRYLPPDLQVVAAIAYRFGWRARSEILPLERRHLDLEHGTLTLDPGKAGLFRVAQIDGQAVKVPTMLTHDFRRTAVRNMERTGVPRSVATKLTGHRTEAVYRRYAIVSDSDLRDASAKLAGTIAGTVTATGSKVRGIN